ncbi:N-acetyl sugar amidotransferase [Polynucleobacter paneuropaeus]|jgi:N-acetyl sugar amidotransferase|uniref:N-acetyl sugar amidotransferase n=1 Tax=Polynucleobacter paneuropaeus TaxID=2527775 RepID=UPI001BFE04C5|nr:N-acetyl sugar amidotransferase [Polynucleobacter paneuropaeus]MBT8633201.1 N-acetyl sugar amidotransferase [Polynucleobacter paneuropaeus]
MSKFQFCKRCLYTTVHPLGLTLDDEGICSGCRVHEEKDALDWNERWGSLERLIKPYRSSSGSNYDCIIPVTGAQDSYYIVYLAKIRLGLNPLLVTYNKYFNTPLGIRNLANLRIRFNCDIISQNVNPVSVKKVTRSTLRQFGSIYWPILAGQTAFPVQTAVRYKIPLIIWGSHQGLEQVGMFSHEHEIEMTRRYRKDHDLMGHEADDLLNIFDTLKEQDIWQYRYPDDGDLKSIGVRGIYLGNYVRWDPKAQHEEMISQYGYRTSRFSRTFDAYDYVDCFNYMNLHDQLKIYKHGFSKVTDHASREIRFGRLNRQEGLALVRKHELMPTKYSELFLEWLGVTPQSMQFLLDQHRNKNFWLKSTPGTWDFRGWSTRQEGDYLTLNGNQKLPDLFNVNDELDGKQEAKYITIGKGV